MGLDLGFQYVSQPNGCLLCDMTTADSCTVGRTAPYINGLPRSPVARVVEYAEYIPSPQTPAYIKTKMTTESIHKQSFSVPSLPTHSVTIYPTRAAIVRDIANVTILPGRNEITLYNLTPNAEEHSITVEGRNTAGLVTDMAVDLVPNALYGPEVSSEDEEDSSPDDEDGEEVQSLKASVEKEKNAAALLYDEEASHVYQLQVASEHIHTWMTKTTQAPSDIMSRELSAYHKTRNRIFSELQATRLLIATKGASLAAAQRELEKAEAAIAKSRRAADNARAIRKRERQFARRERQELKLHTPRNVYRVRITIELESLPKGTTSVPAVAPTGRPERAEDAEVPAGNDGGPSLRVSYITSGASWTPRYDVRLDTLANTGILTYRAHFFNRTGETWGDAKITLSTSQTNFSGLEDKAPWMESWRISLRRKGFGNGRDGGLYSTKERELRDELKRKKLGAKAEIDDIVASSIVASSKLVELSLSRGQGHGPGANGGGGGQEDYDRLSNMTAPLDAHPMPQGHRGVTRRKSVSGLASFRRSSKSNNLAPQAAYIMQSGKQAAPRDYDSDPSDDEGSVTATLAAPSNSLGVATSTAESYGLTTTYDLPGTRTVISSAQVSRYIIAEHKFTDITFSHLSVPKLRPSVFLKARVRNPSPTALLRGPAGLSLDGTFLGTATIPRCAPGDHFELGLGVDESVLVEYRKPIRTVASQGMLVKEQVLTYERCISVYNTRKNHISLVVFDQVPVSDDERLKVHLKKPMALRGGGDTAKGPAAGIVVVSSPDKKAAAGGLADATVEMRKGGEVRWEAKVEGGTRIRIGLEYEAKLPTGDIIFGA